MKIQCSCGVKYAFDVTPDMVRNPIALVCQQCGADNSAAVNALIQQQFASAPPPPEPDAPAKLRVNVHVPAPGAATASDAAGSHHCPKHPGFTLAHQCVVCRKPMCPKCMELFGYVCSPLCRGEAESRGIHVPVYEGQVSARQAKDWRNFRLASFGIAGAIALLVGLWCWYEFSLSRPRVAFSVMFPRPSFSGSAKFVSRNEAVVLHGGHLARYDFKQKKEIWSADPIDKTAIAALAEKMAVSEKADYEKAKERVTGDDEPLRWRPRSAAQIAEDLEHGAADAMRLFVSGTNVWLRDVDKLVRFDWATGKRAQELAVSPMLHEAIESGGALIFVGWTLNGHEALRLDFASGSSETQKLEDKSTDALIAAQAQALIATNVKAFAAAMNKSPRATGPTNKLAAYRAEPQPTFAAQLAAPAIIGAKIRNERIAEAAKDEQPVQTRRVLDQSNSQLINAGTNLVAFTAKLKEEKFIEHQAMKAPPKKAALDDANVSVTSTLAVANDMVNEWQRERTGGIEIEDVSRYEVTLKRIGVTATDWVGEVDGPPSFFALGMVDLLVAGKTLIVLDKQNKELWKASLSFEIAGGFGHGDLDDTPAAPAVEHGNRLYFFDRGVLTCFDIATGNVFWRLPSVGVSKVLFDAKGFLYVETTTDNPGALKMSQQIDLSKRVHPLILKIDPRNGKVLWRSENNGGLAYVSGNILYALEYYGGDEDAPKSPLAIGIETPPHVRITRLSMRNGKRLWHYYEKRAPVDVKFDGNIIQLVFKKELRVLKYLSL